MKKELRKWAKEKRSTLCVDVVSSEIKTKLFSSEVYKNAKNIMCYYSFGSEVSTLEYFSDNSKNWYLPKISDNDLLVCPYCSDFVENKYKINEPNSKPVDETVIDMVIIPALVADKNGYRIGYGKGYYDRFLKKLSECVCKVVLVYSELLINDVHPDAFDEKCDYIVTEKNMLKIG